MLLGYVLYRLNRVKKAIKSFSPVVHTHDVQKIFIGKCEPFTDEEDQQLSQYKDALRLMKEKIEYRMGSYTDIQNSNYRLTNIIGEEKIYALKSDSEKWLEQGKMSGYIDIWADIKHLLAKE